MHDPSPHSLRFRLRNTKAALLAVALTLAGILLIWLGNWIVGLSLGAWGWLHAVPLGELGGVLVGAGLLSTLFEYSFRKDQEAATIEQFRDIIREQAPAMRDAVIEGFAIHPEDLQRVATPELLDDLAKHSLGLRLGDQSFASEIYDQIRDQAITPRERWHDVEVDVRLSTAVERNTKGIPLFDVLVQWEFTVTPTRSVYRFACLSDRTEYEEMLAESPDTSVWFMTPRPGMDASSRS